MKSFNEFSVLQLSAQYIPPTGLVNDFCLCIFIFIIIPFFFDQHCPLVFRFPFVIKLTLSVTFYYFFAPKVFPVTVGGRGTTLKVFFFLLLWAGAKVAL